MLKIGQEIPEFSAKDMDGELITREDLLGAPFVLYFYPKDETPGCTQEACSFRDVMEGMDDLNVEVFGVSTDSVKSHQQFAQKHDLNFPLLSDETKEMVKKFQVLKPEGGIIRSTFLCDAEGTIMWIESPVNVEGHVDRVFQAIETHLE